MSAADLDMARKTTPDREFAKAWRKVMNPKPARRVRAKSAADLEFEKLLADYVENGAAHLASAKAKMSK